MIVVTGATGFVGREFIKKLANEVDVKDILCLVYEKCDNELEITGRKVLDNLGIKYIPIDLISGNGMKYIPKSPDVVYHLASVTVTASKDHRVNDIGTKNLIESIYPLKPEMKFIYTSTICVSDIRPNYSIPISETSSTPGRPANLYGRKKLIAEDYLKEHAKKHKFSLSIIRVCGVYGNGVRVNGLFDSIEKLVKKKSILMRLNWPGKISIIHVNDMADFILNVGKKALPNFQGELYIPSVEELTLEEMSMIVHKATGLVYNPIRLPKIFWSFCSFFAKNKNKIEYLLPHRIYDRFWQACLLVNNEFWNVSYKVFNVIDKSNAYTYKKYYSLKAKEDTND